MDRIPPESPDKIELDLPQLGEVADESMGDGDTKENGDREIDDLKEELEDMDDFHVDRTSDEEENGGKEINIRI